MTDKMAIILAVGLGGAIGSIARYGVAQAASTIMVRGIPIAVISVNILGSFLMGLAVAVFAFRALDNHALKYFILTGLMGGFTTFSAFSLDAIRLFERGQWGEAVGYIFSSVVFSLMALFFGLWIGKQGL